MTAARVPYDAVVIGAGVGGLAAAARLVRAGRRVLVVERDRHVGGTSRVFHRNGFTFPTGPLSFSMPNAVTAMLRDLGAARALTLRRDTFQVRRAGLDVVISVPLERVADQLLVKVDEGEPSPRAGWERSADEFRRDELRFAWWSRRDPGLAPPGCEALVLKIGTPYAPFAGFDGGGRGRHAAEYYTAKERLADELLCAGEAVVPGLRAAVRVREVATPLTFRHWGHRSEGSVAGWSWRADDIAGFQAQDLAATSVPGLRMVGLQEYTRLFWGGVGSSLYSGLSAAPDEEGCACEEW